MLKLANTSVVNLERKKSQAEYLSLFENTTKLLVKQNHSVKDIIYLIKVRQFL